MKLAIGCLVQWYEVEMVQEYFDSLAKAVKGFEKQVIVDITFNLNQSLEKVSSREEYTYIYARFLELPKILQSIKGLKVNIKYNEHNLITIADYRREFNNRYCTEVDILMWGESDMLIPSIAFQTIFNLAKQVKGKTPKWLAFFATCKMWDNSWEDLEHVELTNLPRDPLAWYGTRSYMDYDTMEKLNSKYEDVTVLTLPYYKFNGCGLVLSSDLVKSGANIPKSVFFTHEDTALMNVMEKCYTFSEVPQFVFKDVLLVHNREHPLKRTHIQGEGEGTVGEKRKQQEWYERASKLSRINASTLSLYGTSKIYTWKDVWEPQ